MFQLHTSFNFCKAFKQCFPQTGSVKIRALPHSKTKYPQRSFQENSCQLCLHHTKSVSTLILSKLNIN